MTGIQAAMRSAIKDTIEIHSLVLDPDGSEHGECDPDGNRCGWKGHQSQHVEHLADVITDRLEGPLRR